MRLPSPHIHQLIDCLTRSRFCFGLYRLPWTDECYFVLQTSEDIETLNDISELNGKKGFVMAPFIQSDEHPLILIKPDNTAYDWSEISQSLTTCIYADAILTCKNLPSIPITQLNENERYADLSCGVWHDLKIIIEGSVIEIYVDDKYALSNLMFDRKEGLLGLYAEKNKAEFKEIKIKK